MVSATYILFLLHIPGILCQRIGDLRLYSFYYSEGRLEIYSSYTWTPFSITGFDMHEADLACKKLGYSYASRYAKVGTLGYSQASTTYSISHVSCPSSASSFSSCTIYRTYSYSHSSDVGLRCTNSRSSLRLVSSSGYYYYGVSSGRLEIYVNNTWGTVCNDNFGYIEATVACRQLGFSRYIGYNYAGALSGYTTTSRTPIWLDNLYYCDSSTSDLRQCTNAVGVHDCNHAEDIILTCARVAAYTTATTPYDSSVNAGLAVGLSVASLFLCLALCVGGMCVIGVVYNKKKFRSPSRTIVVQPQIASKLGTYCMSDLEAKEKDPAPNVNQPVTPVMCAPSPFALATLQHDVYPQNGNYTEPEIENAATEIKIQDGIKDLYM